MVRMQNLQIFAVPWYNKVTERQLWGSLISSWAHWKTCMIRQFNNLTLYIAQCPYSLTLTYVLDLATIYKWRRLSIRYPEMSSTTCTWHVWLLIVQGKLCWMYLEICIFGNFHKELNKFWLTFIELNLFEI
jgi:hypothetical protein